MFVTKILNYYQNAGQPPAVSGLAYDAIEFGPVPQRWSRVYSAFDEVECQIRRIQGQECTLLKAVAKADTSVFAPEELTVIDQVCTKMANLSLREASEMIRKETAWKNHVESLETIPFMDAFGLVGM